MKTKKPASTWFRAVALVDTEGFHRGEPVLVRQSREGGWRILGPSSQLVVGDKGVRNFVCAFRGAGGKPIPATDQAAADKHLQDVFRGLAGERAA